MLLSAVFVGIHVFGRTKFAYGKRHCMEKSARIVLVGCYALLIGHAIFGSADKILSGAHYAHDRKDSEADEKKSLSVLFAKASVKPHGNALGNVACAAARAARGTAYLFIHSDRKHNGVYNLNHRLGNVSRSAAGLGKVAKAICAGRASEYAHITLASVKDNLLIYYRHSLKFLTSSLPDASLKHELYKKSDGNAIKSAIESNGVNIDRSPSNIRLLGAHVTGSFYNIVTHIGKMNANVLKAIAIAARIKYSVGFNADRLFSSARAAARKSAFSAV